MTGRRAPVGRCRVVVAASLGAVVVSAASYANRRLRRPRWTAPGGHVVQTSSLRVRTLGDSGRPVLLLHGLVASGIFWGDAYNQLVDHHRLLVPDLLGFGRSPRPASGYGPDDHASAVLACLDDLGIDEPVIIGAHSLGTLIALRLAATHPQRVLAVVAFGPPLYPSAAAARAHVAATSPMGRLFVLPGHTAETACRLVCDHRTLAAHLATLTHPSLPPEIAADAVQHTWNSYSQTLQQVILSAKAATWVSHVVCPVHLVAGDRDPVVDHAYLRHLAETHAHVDLHELPGRHDLPLIHPEKCITMIETASSSAARP